MPPVPFSSGMRGRPPIAAPICYLLLISAVAYSQGADTSSSSHLTDTSGYFVGKILIEQRPVFDENDSTIIGDVEKFSKPIGRLGQTARKVANDIHVQTRQDVIRQELLLKEGDRYDQGLVDESARHLRGLRIVGDVSISNDTIPDRTINLTVHTHDRWTLNPSMTAQVGGGVTGFGVGVRDDNLLGSGQKAEIGYNRLSDRIHPDGGQAAYTEPRLFGSWWTTTAQLRKADELSVASIDISRPFYADAAEWAVRGYGGIGRIMIRQYQNGNVLSDGYLNQQNELFWIASSTGDYSKLQFAGSYYRLRSTADSMSVRPFDNVDLVIASISLLGRQYTRSRYIENFGRVEDVPLGYEVGLALGKNLHFSSQGTVDYYIRVFAQAGGDLMEGLSGNYRASLSSYMIGNVPSEMTISGSAIHYWHIFSNQTLLGRVATTIGSHWDPSSQLTLGSFTGLRGYRNYDFEGQRMLVFNLEHRVFSLVNIWFFKLGTSYFFDSGVVWGQGEGFGGQRF
ncbi:MAG TPA: hypothetical protein VEO56_10915, partial [Bacteroidota bacterium]|nr:hypothetical protein [Bacteroidota bacterium]